MSRYGYSPPTVSPPRSHSDEWGAQRWSQESSIPSPRQWAYQQPSQEDLPSPLIHHPEEESPIGFELVYHNDAERQQQSETLRRQIETQQREIEAQERELGLQDAAAHHVHNVFKNIEDNYDEIINVLGGRIQLEILPMVGPNELISGIDSFFATVIMRKYGTPFRQGEEYAKVNKVLQKLLRAKREYLRDDIRNDIFTWIQFVIRQPDSFQFAYIDCFIEDTFFAYDFSPGSDDSDMTEADNTSCPKGISERLLLSVADACVLYCSQYKKQNKKKTKRTEKNKKAKTKKAKTARRQTARALLSQEPVPAVMTGGLKSVFAKCDNPTYRKLIRLFKKEVPDMNELTKEWSVIFTGDLAANMTTAQIKKEFIDFMERKYRLYGLNHSVAIQIRADEFDAIFERREF